MRFVRASQYRLGIRLVLLGLLPSLTAFAHSPVSGAKWNSCGLNAPRDRRIAQ